MQSLSSNRHPKKIVTELPSINNHKKKELDHLMCAFHGGQRITNFCKNIDCLLPLCPQCIKIHSDQHSKMGVFGEFQTINNCFKQVERQYADMFHFANSLAKLGNQVQQLHHEKVLVSRQSFQKARRTAIDYLQAIFNDFEQAFLMQIQKGQKKFTQQLSGYHDSICQILQNCKNGSRKLQNPNMSLEGLISFYSQYQLKDRIKYYQQSLKQIALNTISVQVQQYQLQRFVAVIKRYLNFGQKNQLICDIVGHTRINTADRYNFQETYNSIKKSQRNKKPSKKIQTEISQSKKIDFRALENNNSGEELSSIRYQKKNEENEYKMELHDLQKFETPLQHYSLEKSRQMKSNMTDQSYN